MDGKDAPFTTLFDLTKVPKRRLNIFGKIRFDAGWSRDRRTGLFRARSSGPKDGGEKLVGTGSGGSVVTCMHYRLRATDQRELVPTADAQERIPTADAQERIPTADAPEAHPYAFTNFVQTEPFFALLTAVAMKAIPVTPSSTVGKSTSLGIGLPFTSASIARAASK
jgi:hypothetical protein